MAAAPPIRSFVIFDLEATGLPGNSRDYPVRVTEIALAAVPRRPVSATLPVPGVEEAATQLATLPPDQRGFSTPQQKRKNQESEGMARAPERQRRRRRQSQTADPGTPPPAATFSPLPTRPRLRDSFLATVNPGKLIPEEVAQITGLDNEQLEELPGFDATLAQMVRGFLQRQPSPVCLVAHNGGRYDFPLLLAELRHCGASWVDTDDILCADSLSFFRELQQQEQQERRVWAPDASTICCRHTETEETCVVCLPAMFVEFDLCDSEHDYEVTRLNGHRAVRCRHPPGRGCVVCEHAPEFRTQPAARRALFAATSPAAGDGGRPSKPRAPSLKLPDIYTRRFGSAPPRQHCAGDDVEALVSLCLSHGEEFFCWADRNSRPLAGFTPMWQRRGPGEQRAA